MLLGGFYHTLEKALPMVSAKGVFRRLRQPKRTAVRLNTRLHRDVLGRTGIEVMDEDWDNLIVLDACRYDIFERHNPFAQTSTPVVSGGTHTNEWLQHNFEGGEFLDTVYISATPQLATLDATFHDIVDLCRDQWDDEAGTVLPETVEQAAIEAAEEYPDKRLIVHYIQPHFPFIGERGEAIEQPTLPQEPAQTFDVDPPFRRLKQGEISKQKLWNAYVENLYEVLPSVGRLVETLDGKTVITADHGNAFGEWGEYGHFPDVFLDSVVKVPWLGIDGKRRAITAEGGGTTPEEPDEVVANRLANLGYRDT